jgi:hypothetical protein
MTLRSLPLGAKSRGQLPTRKQLCVSLTLYVSQLTRLPRHQGGIDKARHPCVFCGLLPPERRTPKGFGKRAPPLCRNASCFSAYSGGCGELAGLDASTGTTLGAVALGRKLGRLAMPRLRCTKRWALQWKIWLLPISLTRGPSEQVVVM